MRNRYETDMRNKKKKTRVKRKINQDKYYLTKK